MVKFLLWDKKFEIQICLHQKKLIYWHDDKEQRWNSIIFIKKAKVNEQEKKVSSVEVLLKTFPTLLSFISFVLWINFHCSFCIINLHHLILVLFCSTSPKRKKKRVWYFLLYTIYFRCNHPLISLVLLCSGSLKKKNNIVKNEIFQFLIFVVVFCVIILESWFYFAPLHKKEKRRRKSYVFSACHRCSHLP